MADGFLGGGAEVNSSISPWLHGGGGGGGGGGAELMLWFYSCISTCDPMAAWIGGGGGGGGGVNSSIPPDVFPWLHGLGGG